MLLEWAVLGRAHMYTHGHTDTHTHMHTCAYIHTHTHTHTHTQELEQMIEPFGKVSDCQVFTSLSTTREPAAKDVSPLLLEDSESDTDSSCYHEWQSQLQLPRCTAYIR